MRLFAIRCGRCGAPCQDGEWEHRKKRKVCKRCAADLRARDAAKKGGSDGRHS